MASELVPSGPVKFLEMTFLAVYTDPIQLRIRTGPDRFRQSFVWSTEDTTHALTSSVQNAQQPVVVVMSEEVQSANNAATELTIHDASSLPMTTTDAGLPPKNESSPLMQTATTNTIHTTTTPNVESSASSYSFTLYPKRWLVLASFMLLNFSNGWIWVTWSPLTDLAAQHWSVSVGSVDALGGIYMYVFVPTNVVSMWLVVHRLGLARGLVVGATLNATGSAVRWIGADTYALVYVGTVVCALAQTFILPMVALLSGNWFGARERATATSLGVLGYQTGMGVALASTVLVEFRRQQVVVGEDHSSGSSSSSSTTTETIMDPVKLHGYLQAQLVVSLLALTAVVVVITTDRAPTPPSTAAASLRAVGGGEGVESSSTTGHHQLATEEDTDGIMAVGQPSSGQSKSYKESVQLIYQNPSSLAFFVVFGLSIGVFYAVPTFLSQFVPTWPPRDRGILGGVFQLMAIVGCWVAGRIVDSFGQQYRRIGLALLVGTTASTVGLWWSVATESYAAMVACGGLALFLSAFMSVGIEFGTALTFPADEAAVYGILDSTAELSGFLLVTLGSTFTQVGTSYVAILLGIVSISFLLLCSLQGESRRPS